MLTRYTVLTVQRQLVFCVRLSNYSSSLLYVKSGCAFFERQLSTRSKRELFPSLSSLNSGRRTDRKSLPSINRAIDSTNSANFTARSKHKLVTRAKDTHSSTFKLPYLLYCGLRTNTYPGSCLARQSIWTRHRLGIQRISANKFNSTMKIVILALLVS